jgi:transcriptional regulator with XRE-family HTH domain
MTVSKRLSLVTVGPITGAMAPDVMRQTRLTPEIVGERIREARLERGWTHEELARRMDANWRTVQRWQKGNLPRLATLLRLADVLGVPESYFVDTDGSFSTFNDLREQLEELSARVDELARVVASLEGAQHEPAASAIASVSSPSA